MDSAITKDQNLINIIWGEMLQPPNGAHTGYSEDI